MRRREILPQCGFYRTHLIIRFARSARVPRYLARRVRELIIFLHRDGRGEGWV